MGYPWGGIRGTPTQLFINSEGRLKPNATSSRHQREYLLRLSLELIAVVNSPGPDDHHKFRSQTEKRLKHVIDDVPVSPKFLRGLGQLGWEPTQLEHELGEAKRRVV